MLSPKKCDAPFLKRVSVDTRALYSPLLRACCFCLPTGVGPASVMVGNLVAGKRIAQASGRDLGQIEENDLVRKVSACGISCGFVDSH